MNVCIVFVSSYFFITTFIDLYWVFYDVLYIFIFHATLVFNTQWYAVPGVVTFNIYFLFYVLYYLILFPTHPHHLHLASSFCVLFFILVSNFYKFLGPGQDLVVIIISFYIVCVKQEIEPLLEFCLYYNYTCMFCKLSYNGYLFMWVYNTCIL